MKEENHTIMINWNYNENDYNANKTDILAEGKYRVRITNATQTVAKNGTEGLEISLEVSGHSNKLRHYIWYNRDNKARTNQFLGEFFNSFAIAAEERNHCEMWIGKKGAVYVMHDEYKGRTIAKVALCISRDQQEQLPEWQDKPSDSNDGVAMGEDIRLPFDKKMFIPKSFPGVSF